VNNCSVFTSSKDCVEKHCMWEGNSCKSRCSIHESKTECKRFRECFWVEGNETEKCALQVYEKIVKMNKILKKRKKKKKEKI
jgi:hypothetical protein